MGRLAKFLALGWLVPGIPGGPSARTLPKHGGIQADNYQPFETGSDLPESGDMKLTPYEKGYLARRQGAKLEHSPFDPDAAPWSFRKWNEGFKR